SETTSVEVRVDALIQITQAIETAATLDELLLLALYELARLFNVTRGGVALLDDSGSAQIVSEYPPQVARAPALQPADVLSLRRIMNKRQPVHIYDIDRDSKHHRISEALRARDLRSALLIPLIAQDNPLGVLALGAVEPHRFGA